LNFQSGKHASGELIGRCRHIQLSFYLSPDKRKVFQDVFRVLRPEGRPAISGVLKKGKFTDAIKGNEEAYSEAHGSPGPELFFLSLIPDLFIW
jgi:hypothetical protein